MANISSNITLPSCKSDIARLILLYEFGGYYVDTHGRFRNKATLFKDLHEKIEPSFDLVIAAVDTDNKLVNRFMAGKRKSLSLRAFVDGLEQRMVKHYNDECTSKKHIPYHLAFLTGIKVFAKDCNITYRIECAPLFRKVRSKCFDNNNCLTITS